VIGQHHRTLAASLLLVALVFAAADCLMTPTPNPVPAPATRLPVTVLPTGTVYVFEMVPTFTVTPREMILMTPTTRVPTVTRTPMPNATPVPPTPDRPPIQRG
jgi:hypothetical protein